MEGRAIARPNPGDVDEFDGGPELQWRAEQLLGQTSRTRGPVSGCSTPSRLQWRAEQLLGQTTASRPDSARRCSRFNGGPSNCSSKRGCATVPTFAQQPASMEGRAIARPNTQSTAHLAGTLLRASMEGRAIARPNSVRLKYRMPRSLLQWRAEQLLGQTAARTLSTEHQGRDASMEGRAIARPNRSPDLGSLTCPFAGLCERSRKRELRRCLDSVVKLRFALCHKGSSGP